MSGLKPLKTSLLEVDRAIYQLPRGESLTITDMSNHQAQEFLHGLKNKHFIQFPDLDVLMPTIKIKVTEQTSEFEIKGHEVEGLGYYIGHSPELSPYYSVSVLKIMN